MGNQSSRNTNQEYNQYPQDPSFVLRPFLYLGGASVNQDPNLVNYYGITHILNLAYEITPNMHLYRNRNIQYKHIRADDALNYNIRNHFEEAFEMIDDARRTNGKILVHCAMGISRSATIVIAYLINRYDMSLNEAFDFVKSRRSIVA
ncbi:unnamed protein product, partial [Brachionus calyciflorus]